MALDEARHLTLRESRDFTAELSDDEAAGLQALGKRLAGSTEWWGAAGEAGDRSVVTCTPAGAGKWTIRVSDAVGLIRLPSLQISIEPKIPITHLLYVLEASGGLPRLDPERALAMRDLYFWELILRWYVEELELLLRRGLLRDYEETNDRLSTLRGSVDPLETARLYYAGQLALECVFDEFDFDTPPNRLLLMAARVVARAPISDVLLRGRALRATARFERVGDLRPTDLRWRPERRAGYYGSAITLARHIVRGVGRGLTHGHEQVTSFLFRTPEMVEEGLRRLLVRELPHRTIEKRGLQLQSSTMTLNPDLVFESGSSVGDVKYKVLAAEWSRDDLYQLVAFATGFRSGRAVLVHFRAEDADGLLDVRVGEIEVCAAAWPAREDIAPAEALSSLCKRIDEVLS